MRKRKLTQEQQNEAYKELMTIMNNVAECKRLLNEISMQQLSKTADLMSKSVAAIYADMAAARNRADSFSDEGQKDDN